MNQSISRKRPWLAALLAAVVTGLGHLYLRRWRRALGWLAAAVGATVLLGEPAALDALASGTAVDPLAAAPSLIVGGLSVVDAYLVARAQNGLARRTTAADGRLTHCPNCGKELDPDLSFCHWCTADLGEVDVATTDETEEQTRH
ncbi:zinc ribbon domain-containing protein [Halomicrobium salinisoli]|uniref:zinc ribbon domain-containing protein n=1 Tax=Halomicrobium salinisoli TaxID=2878391 RepID=UPI001CF0BAC8|nr:zinc ribbon domain-containing protein [Halomicrobium salinisoli]